MTALAAPWFEDDSPRDLARWSVAAALVLAIHAAAIAGYLLWHQPEGIGDEGGIVSVELAPIDGTPDAEESNAAPAPEDMAESQPQPKPEDKPPEEKVEQPPPPEEAPTVMQEEKPQEKVEETPPPAPRDARKVKSRLQTAALSAYEASVTRHLQRYKRYPSEAVQRSEEGLVLLSFSLDRNGHVLSRRVVRSSGFANLDNEAMATILRAQPWPAMPATMTQQQVDLTVPMRFSLH
jgi:protein TonB